MGFRLKFSLENQSIESRWFSGWSSIDQVHATTSQTLKHQIELQRYKEVGSNSPTAELVFPSGYVKIAIETGDL